MFNVKKGVYPYEYMDSWKRFDETSLPEKEDFHNNLNMEDITATKKAWKNFEIKNLGKYLDLYVQSHTLLLADVFEIFTKGCIKIYELDSAHFLYQHMD